MKPVTLCAVLVQIGAFGDPGRDPRGWCVTVAYAALVPSGLDISSSKLHHRSRQAGKAAFFIPSLTHASTFAMRHQSTRSKGCSADVVSYGVLHMLVALPFVDSVCNGFFL